VYAAQFAEVVVILQAFQKKSTHGVATPKKEIELIRSRLKLAEVLYEDWKAQRGDSNA
jgi:phage-related protein